MKCSGPLNSVTSSNKTCRLSANGLGTPSSLWCVERNVVARLVHDGTLLAGTGRAGTVLIFGDLMVHSSPPNMSPYDRRIFSLILNPVTNAYTRDNRPDWKHHRDLTPIRSNL